VFPPLLRRSVETFNGSPAFAPRLVTLPVVFALLKNVQFFEFGRGGHFPPPSLLPFSSFFFLNEGFGAVRLFVADFFFFFRTIFPSNPVLGVSHCRPFQPPRPRRRFFLEACVRGFFPSPPPFSAGPLRNFFPVFLCRFWWRFFVNTRFRAPFLFANFFNVRSFSSQMFYDGFFGVVTQVQLLERGLVTQNFEDPFLVFQGPFFPG